MRIAQRDRPRASPIDHLVHQRHRRLGQDGDRWGDDLELVGPELGQRQVRLAEDIDPEGARARYEHGIVTISLPVTTKPPVGQRHSIAVERG